ncbi:amidohydrolase family protein [Hymenobacter pini]|uniref:amidohydrolase family protein n=1 Tax=Hymenobacter pini TaxID=2880879 RepID=UPI001CF44279|nr:amidohydrolase family protein [Hymenobacter pini]MCA8829787.1 amidohydrolase family protein [Hymenobacter pini]
MFCAKAGLAQQAPVLVITNTNVVPLNQNTVLRRQTVLIKQGRIQQIGDAGKIRIPQGAVVVKGDNKYLLPGLIDMHAHLPGPEGTPHTLDTYFRLNLASGVTGLRSMRGDTSHLRWRDSLRRTAAHAPHLYLGSPVFTRDKAYSARKGQRLLTRYKASGYDFIKYLGGMSAPQYDSLLTDAHRLGLKVAGHAPKSGLRGAIAAGMTSVEHIEPFIEAYQQDSVQFRALARQMAAQGIYTCPDLYWYKVTWLQYSSEQLQQLPGLNYIDPKLREEWQTSQAARIQQLTSQNALIAAHAQIKVLLQTYQRAFRIMHEEGVKFLISPGDGNFVVPGFGMAEELTLLVKQGLSPYEALQAATVNAATWLGEQDQRGTVVPGKAGDLVLLDANPLTDISNVRKVNGVVLNGRWIPVRQLLPPQQ